MSLIPFGFWAASGAGGGGGAYDLLETTTLTSSASSVTFSGLGSYSDYAHLQIRIVARNDSAYNGGTAYLHMNSDTGNSYSRHYFQGNGSTVTAVGQADRDFMDAGQTAGGNLGSNIFAASVTDILDFSSTTKKTTMRTLSGVAGGTFNVVKFGSALYNNTAAVTNLNFYAGSTDNFVAGSRFSIYGIKGA